MFHHIECVAQVHSLAKGALVEQNVAEERTEVAHIVVEEVRQIAEEEGIVARVGRKAGEAVVGIAVEEAAGRKVVDIAEEAVGHNFVEVAVDIAEEEVLRYMIVSILL